MADFEQLITDLRDRLYQEPAVHALWLEGSLADGRHDQYSDVDLWLDVSDGFEAAMYQVVEAVLQTRGSLDVMFELPKAHPQLRHRIYHLAGTSPYQTLDVNVQSHSRQMVLTRGVDEVHILFDKDGTIRWQAFDERRLRRDLAPRTTFLRDYLAIGQPLIAKQIARGRFMEAHGYYLKWCLMPLVELLRIKYCPAKSDFGSKHLERDLPAAIVAELEPLFVVRSVEDIERNTHAAAALLHRYLET